MGSGRHRSAALLLAGLVLAAACGSSSDDAAVDTPSTTVPTPADPVTGEGGPSVAAGSGAPLAETPPAGTPPPADPPVVAPPDPPRGPEPETAPAPVPVGPVGSLGPRYLRPAESDQVLVQLLVQEGAAPQPAVPERIRQVLSSLSGKPVAVDAVAVPGGPPSWTGDDLRALADRFSPAQSRERAVLTLAFLRGGFADSDSAVGVAVRGDVAAVFSERVTEAAGVFASRSAVEDAVALHEVGHLLGLVDLVVDTDRADPEHPGHSPNRGSVMYFAVESTLLGSLLSGGPPRDFDQDDLDELTSIRNG